jgi:hypothetical protein
MTLPRWAPPSRAARSGALSKTFCSGGCDANATPLPQGGQEKSRIAVISRGVLSRKSAAADVRPRTLSHNGQNHAIQFIVQPSASRQSDFGVRACKGPALTPEDITVERLDQDCVRCPLWVGSGHYLLRRFVHAIESGLNLLAVPAEGQPRIRRPSAPSGGSQSSALGTPLAHSLTRNDRYRQHSTAIASS